MTKIFPVLFFVLSSVGGTARAGEIWLTPQRAAELRRVTSRPYIVSQERIGGDTVVYRWTNGLHGAVTTQKVGRVLGAKAESAWGKKLKKAEAQKAAILADIDALRKKPSVSQKDLDSISEKHSVDKRKAK